MSGAVAVARAGAKARAKATPERATEWDTQWAAERAAEALQYLGRNFPEILENSKVLDAHEELANEAATRGDREDYLEALRGYMRAGRAEALRIRRSAA